MALSSTRDEARRAMLEDLAAGRAVTDVAFDRLYPERIRKLSSLFWTPVDIARHAARLFVAHGARRVLDMGAGVGKFCIVAALETELELIGVEHRKGLVDIAQRLVEDFSIPRVTMLHGTIGDLDLDVYDGFYLYNPFEEGACESSEWMDKTAPLSRERAERDVATVEAFLARARRGTCVVTYHGFGGAMPEGWIYLAKETRGKTFLRLWVRG